MPSNPNPAPDSLEQQISRLISERLLETSTGFDLDSDLYEVGLDSMAIMQLLVLVEKEFGAVIPDSDLTRHNFSSVRQLAQIIRDRSAHAA